jgi:flagellar hook-associated protein 2
MINGTYSGQDVAGTINGETADGSGQVLRGNDDNSNTAGLSVTYSGTADNSDAGNIKLTLGIAELFSRSLFGITDPLEGYVSFKQTSLQASIDSKETQIEQMEAFLERKSEMMISRYVTMEKALNMIQSQGDWLTSQLNALYSYS